MAHFPELVKNAIDFARANGVGDLQCAAPWQCPKSPGLLPIWFYLGNSQTPLCGVDFVRGLINGPLAIWIVRFAQLCAPQFSLSSDELLRGLVEDRSLFFAPHRVAKNGIAENLRRQRMR